MFNLIKNKRIVLLLIGAFIVVTVVLVVKWNGANRNGLNLYRVERQDLTSYLFETGTVKQGEEAWLSFSQSGRIEAISVQEGQKVSRGDELVQLDNSSLILEKRRAEEALSLARADHQRFMAGASKEEREYYQVALNNAETALLNAQAAHQEAIQEKQEAERLIKAEESTLYGGIKSSLSRTSNQGLDSLFFLTEIQYRYFQTGTHESLKLADAKAKAAFSFLGAENAGYWNQDSLARQRDGARGIIASAEDIPEVDQALGVSIKAIRDIESALEAITVSNLDSTAMASVSAEKTKISVILAELTAGEQSVKSHRVSADNIRQAKQRIIDSAERQVQSVQGTYNLAAAQWQMISRLPTVEEEEIYLIRIKQAEAETALATRRLQDSILKAPFQGQVVELVRSIGETIQPGQSVLRLRPIAPFQIEVDIYEGDIGRVAVGQLAEIDLVAFPDQTIRGRVSFINSSSRVINNVVYYPIKLEIEEELAGLKTGLTADVRLILQEKADLLVIPEGAVFTQDGKSMVRIYSEEGIGEREVVVGMRGEGFRVEIISGLQPGEQIIIR